LRVDQVQKDTKNKYLLDFVSGDLILSVVNPLQDYAMGNFVKQRVDYTARSSKWFDLSYFLPGGYLDAGKIYGTRDTNCLTGQRADEVLDSVMIDSSESYDLKIEEVEEKFKAMVNTVKNSAALISAMGYGSEDPVFNLTIESKQFYAEGNNTGGDNWECGQYLLRYLPALPGSCGAMQQRGNSSYFLSSPLDFNCKTKTLYRVEETYRINRNTHQDPGEPSKTAFIVTYVESKENLRKPDDEDTNVLWDGSLLETAAIKETPFVRHCVYSMDSKRYELTKQCEWEEFELLEDTVRWNRA